MASAAALNAPAWMALSSAAYWLLASLLVGAVANRLPPGWLQSAADFREGPSPPRRRRRRGAAGIRRWKRWIPDAGAALPGGVAKASLVSRDPAVLRRLLVETRRAELVHWSLWAAALAMALWLPPAAVGVNLVFAAAFNLPCLVLQRFNRRRVCRLLARQPGGCNGLPQPHASR